MSQLFGFSAQTLGYFHKEKGENREFLSLLASPDLFRCYTRRVIQEEASLLSTAPRQPIMIMPRAGVQNPKELHSQGIILQSLAEPGH